MIITGVKKSVNRGEGSYIMLQLPVKSCIVGVTFYNMVNSMAIDRGGEGVTGDASKQIEPRFLSVTACMT